MASGARHDALLDLRRSAPSDLPQRWEGGRAGASCDPSAAAVRLKAVVELYAVFKEIAGEALGGRKCHSHFEQWLWACRVDLIVSGAICAPVLTAVPPARSREWRQPRRMRDELLWRDATSQSTPPSQVAATLLLELDTTSET